MGAEQSTAAPGEEPRLDAGFTPVQKDPEAKAVPLVLVGPSGVGKGTLIERLMKTESERFGFTTSHTTRSPRAGEKNGQHYHFVGKESFCRDIAESKFLEYAEVHGNLYGTSFDAVEKVMESGRCCLLDVDVQGARNIRKSGARCIIVFLAPPSLEDLAKRLAGRGTESAEQMERRLSNAKTEINSLNEKGLYDYLIINDKIEEAVERLLSIAQRAVQGLDPEPGQVPEQVIIEEANIPDISQLHSTAGDAGKNPSPQPSGQDLNGFNGLSVSLASEATPSTTMSHTAMSDTSALSPSATSFHHLPSPQLETPASNRQQLHSEGTAAAVSLSEQPQPGVHLAASSALTSAGGGIVPSLQGKIALVTGASSGIGWAVCESLALAGLQVVAVARRKEKLEELQQHMHNVLGVPLTSFLPVVCDITKEAEVATLPKIVAKRWPDGAGIDVLVNNAGMSRANSSLFDGDVGNWVAMLSTNVLGTCMCIKTVLQDMRRRNRYGHIINMVGLSGHRIPDGPQGGGFYCATKAAVKTITEGLRQEARGQHLPLRVSAISPGIVETEFFAVKYEGDEAAARNATSAFKCLQPEDIAKAILWCLQTPEHMEVNDIVIRPTEQLL